LDSLSLLTDNTGIGVQLVHEASLPQGVSVDLGDLNELLSRTDGLDDLLGANDLGEVSRVDLVERNGPSLLQLGGVSGTSSVDGIQFLESRLGPDDKTAEMSSGSDLEKVESLNVENVNSGNVTEGTSALSILTVNDDGAKLLLVLPVAHFSFASTSTLGSINLLNISPNVRAAKERDGLLGLAEGLDLVGNNERDLGDLVDDVPTSLEKSWDSGGGDGGADSVTLLGYVDTTMPAAEDLQGSEHVSSTAHVSESSLSGTVGSSSTNTRNTGNGTSSSPGFSRVLLSG
jgi:hypothetical protein